MPDTTVRVEYIGAVQNFSEVTITGNQQVWRIGSSAFVETGRASQLVASGKFRSLANDPAMLPANQAKVGATPSGSGNASSWEMAFGDVVVRPALLAGTSDISTVTGLTVEASMGAVVIPADTVRPHDRIEISATISKTGTGSSVFRARVGGETLLDGITLPSTTQTTNLALDLTWVVLIGADLAGPHYVMPVATSATSVSPMAQITVDFSVDVPVTINVTPSVSGDASTLVNCKIFRIGNP